MMRINLMVGMLAGGVIGAAAAIIAMPYLRSDVSRLVKRGKKVINKHLDKMDDLSDG